MAICEYPELEGAKGEGRKEQASTRSIKVSRQETAHAAVLVHLAISLAPTLPPTLAFRQTSGAGR